MNNDHRVPRRKIVIGHPRLGRGGSEERVMWLIEALKRDYEVSVVTTGGWNLDELNDYYGTHVQEDEVKVRVAPVPVWARGFNAAALRGACFQRFARQIAGEYDVRISAYNPTDWGLPAVHFIADFSWHQEIRDRFDPRTPGFLYRDTMLRRAYLRAAAAYGKPSGRNVLRDDMLVANSYWSAALVKQYCGVECTAVVYPSVGTEFPHVPWEEKEQAFAMIGRIAPEKQIEQAIAILEKVRQRGHAVRLHLCGEMGHDLYGRQIARLCKERVDWIIPEGRVSGARKRWILAHCRFGIQTRAAEPFGISVAEMVKAGAVVFAPNDGGQTEILQNANLLFADVDDAADKISSVLSDAAKQTALRGALAQRSKVFTSANFVQSVGKLDFARTTSHHSGVSYRHRQKVVIGHPRLGRGGSESIVMWLIEALKRDFDVTIVTTGGWDLGTLNAYYGTEVKEGEVTVRPAPIPFLVGDSSAAALRGACFQRFASEIAGDYDIRISAYNPTDWGMPAIHFIADFSWQQQIREQLDPPSPGLIYRKSPFRSAYLRAAAAHAKPSGRDVLRDDLLVANSHWSAALLRQYCGVDSAVVVYPPVWSQFPQVSWNEKEQAFVMIGRIAPEKQVEQAIAILEQVRQRGHSIRLHLCGHIGHDRYGRRIARLCQERSEWIIPEGIVSGARKTQILTQCRYGIQTRAAEPFGIAVAEMAKAGAIVFASNDGGQTEILEHPELLFTNVEDAAEKICKVLEQPSLQLSLRSHLAGQTKRFSSQIFTREAQGLVSRMTNNHRPEVSPVTMQAV